MRIVSLVPSLTELVLYLGADVVGRTTFCVHPTDRVKHIPKVGGTKTVHTDQVIALRPDLVIANKEENTRAAIDILVEAGLRVWVSDIPDYPAAIDSIRTIGALTDTIPHAEELVSSIHQRFQHIPSAGSLSVCYLIWRKPYMTVGRDTYIHSILTLGGYTNVYADELRYPEVTLRDLADHSADVILLSSEPYPFAEKHVSELQEACPKSKIVLVDGEVFSWYGSKMLDIPHYLHMLLKSIGQRQA